MKTYWRTAAAVAALAASLTLGALLPATPGHTQVARTVVRVLQNGPNDAVPVTLQGSGASAGNVNVVNTPSVNVANSPMVLLSNPAASPGLTRDVDHLVTYQANDLAPGVKGNREAAVVLPAVPAGKRLVIDYVSAMALVGRRSPPN